MTISTSLDSVGNEIVALNDTIDNLVVTFKPVLRGVLPPVVVESDPLSTTDSNLTTELDSVSVALSAVRGRLNGIIGALDL